jgi:hypothetical protein
VNERERKKKARESIKMKTERMDGKRGNKMIKRRKMEKRRKRKAKKKSRTMTRKEEEKEREG